MSLNYVWEPDSCQKYGSIEFLTSTGIQTVPRKTTTKGKLSFDLPDNVITTKEAIDAVLYGAANSHFADKLDYTKNIDASFVIDLADDPVFDGSNVALNLTVYALVGNKKRTYDLDSSVLELLSVIFNKTINSVMNKKYASAHEILDVLIEKDPNVLEYLSGIPMPENMTQQMIHSLLDDHMRRLTGKTLLNWIDSLGQ